MAGLEEAREASEGADWTRAMALLDAAGAEASGAPGLELRAMAAYGNGDYEVAVSAWEQLYELHIREGDRAGAARAGAMAAMFLLIDTGLMATVRGWLRRVERLLVEGEETPAHALAAAVQTYERFMCGDMHEAGRQAARAIELGDRCGVNAAVVIGRTAAARVKIFLGSVDEGLAELEELGVLLTAGVADPLTTGMMYCELVCAAQGLGLHERAREWTELMERWRHGVAFGGINGRCRVHRAELLRMSGPCDEAEAEALRACEELRPWMRREFGWPLAELGTIRLRKGDLAGAEEALLAAHEHTWSPHPGLALLRLEQGDVGAAGRLIADAVEHPIDIPSKERPPFGQLRLAPLLDAQAEIAYASGDAATTRKAADRLRAIADGFPSRALAASATLAGARAALLEGDTSGAIQGCMDTAAIWADIGAPFETAMARTLMGEAHARVGNLDAARLEWRAAQTAFAAFGAAGWADKTRALIAGRPTAFVGEPPPATRGIFHVEAGTRTVGLGGETVTLADLVGLRYIARMLAEPGREFHALDLVAVEQGTLPAGRSRQTEGIPVLDEQAREAYQRRLAEVDADIDDATECNDLGRRALAESDREYLLTELRRAVGLGGRVRRSGGSAERARTSVTRSIRYALKRLADHHPDLARHLERRVRTGVYCCYEPDPLVPTSWQVWP